MDMVTRKSLVTLEGTSQKHRGRRGPRAPIAGRPAPVRPSPGIGCPARAASPVSAPRARRRPLSLADQGGEWLGAPAPRGGWVPGRPGCGWARPASPRALPARSSAAPGGQDGGVEQPSAARGAGGRARPEAARGTDAAGRRPEEASRWAAPAAVTALRFASPGRSRGYLVAGSGPGRACGGESHSGPTSGLRRLCAASAGCSGLSSERRLKTTGTAIEAGMLWYWYFH
nr:translation initiation factor IF-2-like [Equus asinus]